MFGSNRPAAPTIHDRGHSAGMNRDGRGVSPLLGGVAGTLLQNLVARKLAGRYGGRAGGIKGMLIGMGVTYAVNRLLGGGGRRRSRFF